jgi:hypothetical protein
MQSQPKKITKFELIAPTLLQEQLSNLFSTYSARNQQEYYSTKGEGDIDKLKQWAYIGKMAEYAVFNKLITLDAYKIIIPPDIMIYEKKRKSHAADIVADGKQIHVKSCMVKEGRDNSWLFSTEDRLVKRPTDEDVIALVTVTLPSTFEAYFIPAVSLVGMYEKPIHAKTVAHALYESTIMQELC